MTAVQETHNDYFGILEMFSDQNTQHEIDAANLKKACNKIKQTFLFFCFSGKWLISEQVRSTHKDGLLKHSKICKTWFSCYKYQITRHAHFSRFGFLARCEKKWPISREKLREMREISCTIFWPISQCSISLVTRHY